MNNCHHKELNQSQQAYLSRVLPLGHAKTDVKVSLLQVYINIFCHYILKNNNFGPQNWGGPAL